MNNIKDIVKKDSIFLANNKNVFLSDRVEKMTLAVYMVTDFFPNEEPLKLKIREKSIELMSFIMSFKDLKKDEISYQTTLLVSEIESLLRIALVSKNISEMNYSILSREYKKVLESIEEKNNQDEQFILLEDFFKKDIDSSDGRGDKDAKKIEDKEIYKGHSKGHSENIKDTTVSLRRINKGQKNKIERKKPSQISKTSTAKIDRKELIIKFIKDKKEVSVKDIVKVIKNCSEKTIQRDLVNMVKSDVLKKKGERRWSRYSIK